MSGKHVVVVGASGFLGQSLTAALLQRGDRVTGVSRSAIEERPGLTWRSYPEGCDAVDEADAVVNLVGRTVDCRKTPKHRREILESRVQSVRAIGAAVRAASSPPPVWIQGSSAHLYGDPPPDVLIQDDSPPGEGFAPDVVRAWEAAFDEELLPTQRGVALRISFVIGAGGGALRRLLGLVRWGLGGHTGNGRQVISWIHEHDLNQLMLRAIDDDALEGTYLTTSPEPVSNREFMATVRSVWRRPWSPPVPSFLVRLGCATFMNTDPELTLLGRRCVPSRLQAEGLAQFRFPALRGALEEIRDRSAAGVTDR